MKASEHQIQAAYFQWVRWMEQKDARYQRIAAVPNGGLRNLGVARKLKAEGVRRGVPDVLGFVRGPDSPGFAIEFKTERGRLSDEQIEWMEILSAQDWAVFVARSFEEAKAFTEQYMG